MTEQRVNDMYTTFQIASVMGQCTVCGSTCKVIHHVVDMSSECFNCMLERVMNDESERAEAAERRAKCELFMKDFAEI